MEEPSISDSSYRTVISRAYYAAFNVSYSFIKDTHHHIHKTDNKHSDTRLSLERSAIGGLKNAGKKLNRLRRLRNSADYDEVFIDSDLDFQAKVAIEEANSIIKIIAGRKLNEGSKR